MYVPFCNLQFRFKEDQARFNNIYKPKVAYRIHRSEICEQIDFTVMTVFSNTFLDPLTFLDLFWFANL